MMIFATIDDQTTFLPLVAKATYLGKTTNYKSFTQHNLSNIGDNISHSRASLRTAELRTIKSIAETKEDKDKERTLLKRNSWKIHRKNYFAITLFFGRNS